jgi:precorrin-2 dehydrogenase/sirohydrochlorin ferrochelatase
MANLLPVVLNVEGKKAVVFGGGKVAERRIAKIKNSGANVTVISKGFTRKIEGLKGIKKIKEEINADNVEKFIEGADFIFIATDDKDLNDLIEKIARTQKKLFNRANGIGDFIIPASIKIDDILLSISTKGKSPALARALKKRIRKLITKEDVLRLELYCTLRKALKEKISEQRKRKEIAEEIINMPQVQECLKKHEIERAKREVLEQLEKCMH